jgi:hypothetical protein
MTTEITHPPTDREVLHLLVEREWLQDMQARLEEVLGRLEALAGRDQGSKN